MVLMRSLVAWFVGRIPAESIIEVFGTLAKPGVPIQSAEVKACELQIAQLYVISAASPVLPFQVSAAHSLVVLFRSSLLLTLSLVCSWKMPPLVS
jgi:hypothetical protein